MTETEIRADGVPLETQAHTHTHRIWIAGDYDDAIRAAREFCEAEGACFAVTRAAYVYTGGMEDGVCATLIHYPRFPSEPWGLEDKALRFAEHLRARLFQMSATVEGPERTIWLSWRESS